MEENSGYVYALINPSLEGLVRIEVTKGDPTTGAKDLSIATRASSPYIVIFQQWFKDCMAAAEFVQKRLAEHISASEEGFFKISNTDAVLAILEARSHFDTSTSQVKTPDIDTLEDTAKRNRRNFCIQLLEEGQRFQHGDESMPRDEEKALRAYEKAIEMNCFDANRLLGALYFERSVTRTGSEQDLQRALKFFETGIAKGNTRCWGDAAGCYEKLREYRNAEKCWVNFWEQMKEKMPDLDRESRDLYTSRFQEYMTSPERAEHRRITLNLATHVGASYDEMPEGKNESLYESLMGMAYLQGSGVSA